MSGLVGHLNHLYDNRNLTFNEIFTILHKAATGNLERVTEKIDGMNLVFSYDLINKQVKVSRGSDIKSGGMDAKTLAAKFAGRGSVEEAFNKAFKVLSDAVEILPYKTKRKVFGPHANRWYSIEVIYTKNPNIIHYDSDCVVFHSWPVFLKDAHGNVKIIEDEIEGVNTLTSYIDRMQKAVSNTDWKIYGPAVMCVKKFTNMSVYTNVCKNIENVIMSANVPSSSTINVYLKTRLKKYTINLDLIPELEEMVLSRCIQEEGSPTLIDIKKKLDKPNKEKVSEFVKNSSTLLKAFLRPIELAINDFAVELLCGMKSTLVSDTNKEIERIRIEVKNAITAIKSVDDSTALTTLTQQLEKLQKVENITTPVEGIVFIWGGIAYKFTGSFAAYGQILGFFRYGRNGMKPKISNK